MQTQAKNPRTNQEGWQQMMLRTAIQFQMVKLIRSLPTAQNETNAELHKLADEWEDVNKL